jgi:hypothetical protein
LGLGYDFGRKELGIYSSCVRSSCQKTSESFKK